jgi:hypothetical protein
MNDKMISSTTTSKAIDSNSDELRDKFVKQFFIYYDYNKQKPTSISFQQWLTLTDYSNDKEICNQRMETFTELQLTLQSVNPQRENIHVTNTETNKTYASSTALSNEKSKTLVSVAARTSSSISQSCTHISGSTSSLTSRSSSSASSKSSSRKKKHLTDHDNVFVPSLKMINPQDIAFFNMKAIEKECSWPMEYKVSTENISTFTNMITEKVNDVCKHLFSAVVTSTSSSSDNHSTFDGQPYSPTISWSPYQIYCGIAQCNCEQELGVPHFLFDISNIPRDIAFSVLIDKDPNNEENKKIKENLYHQMKKENGLGRKIWQNGRNRVR